MTEQRGGVPVPGVDLQRLLPFLHLQTFEHPQHEGGFGGRGGGYTGHRFCGDLVVGEEAAELGDLRLIAGGESGPLRLGRTVGEDRAPAAARFGEEDAGVEEGFPGTDSTAWRQAGVWRASDFCRRAARAWRSVVVGAVMEWAVLLSLDGSWAPRSRGSARGGRAAIPVRTPGPCPARRVRAVRTSPGGEGTGHRR